MLNFQEKIRELLQLELNRNTQGLNFEVSLYNVKTNSLLENTEQIDQTYATEQKRFIPVLIEDISGDYVDLKDINAVEASINLSLLIPTDSQDFNNIVIGETYQKVALAMDELRDRLQATPLALGNVKYVVDEDWFLGFNLSLYDPNFFEAYVTFTDDSEGIVFTAVSQNNVEYVLSKNDTSLVLTQDGVIKYTYVYEQDKEIRIVWALDNGRFKLWVETFSYISPKASLVDASVLFDEVTFGRCFMALKEVNSGDLTNGNLLFNVKISDFETLSNDVNDNLFVDITEAKNASKKGSLGRIVFGFSIPNPTTNQFTFGNGLNYQQFELALDAFITDQVFLGNEVKYYLSRYNYSTNLYEKEVEIFPFFRDESFVSETDASQVVGEQISKFTAIQSVIGKEYSIYLKEEKKIFDLVKKIVSETPNPNHVYKFRVEYPLFEKEYNVIITQGALGISNNTPISVSFKLDLASNAVLPTS